MLTSLWEGLPISLLEAMYMKKICIVSDVIGNRDVIENEKNGFIIKNVGECEKILKNIIEKNTETKKIKETSYNDVNNKYNVKNMLNKYIKSYEGW